MQMGHWRETEIQFLTSTESPQEDRGKIGELFTTCSYITANMLMKHFDSLLLMTYKTIDSIEKLSSGHFFVPLCTDGVDLDIYHKAYCVAYFAKRFSKTEQITEKSGRVPL